MATAFEIFTRALSEATSVVGALGDELVVFPPDAHYGYHCTPANALTFGRMGVDGVHYAVLTIEGEVCDYSPVIQISPMDADCYHVLAPTFLDYLAAGCSVPATTMADVLACEECGQSILVSFLRERFDGSQLWPEGVDEHRFDDLLSYIQTPTGRSM